MPLSRSLRQSRTLLQNNEFRLYVPNKSGQDLGSPGALDLAGDLDPAGDKTRRLVGQTGYVAHVRTPAVTT